jgi:hypothetical protein
MLLYKNRADSFIGGVYFNNTFLSGVKEFSFGSFFSNTLKFIKYLLLLLSLNERYVLLSKFYKSDGGVRYPRYITSDIVN